MKHLHSALTAFLLGCVILGSCKKSNNTGSSPSPEPGSKTVHRFQVDFNNSTIDITKVDSVTVELKTVGKEPVTQKMERGANLYRIDNVGYDNSTVNVSINVYVPKPTIMQGTTLPTARVFVFYTDNKANVALSAPSDIKKDNWKLRAVFNNDINHIRLIVGESQQDPYFFLKAANPYSLTYVYVGKTAHGANNEFIDGDAWEGWSDPPNPPIFVNGNNTVIDSTSFASYVARIGNKQWSKGEIFVRLIQNHATNGIVYYYIYDERKQ